MNSAARPRYEQIAETIRERIRLGQLAAGMRIPSYRTLMEQHGAAIVTVRQAIAALQSERLVLSVPGVGCVVAEQEARVLSVGLVVLGSKEAPETMDALTLVHDELSALNCDVVVRFMPKAGDEDAAALVAWARRRDGVLLQGRIPVRVAEQLVAAGVPATLVGEPLDGECPAGASMVCVDVPELTRQAMGHLVGLGHRRVALCNGTGSRYYEALSSGFRAAASEYGSEVTLVELRLETDRRERLETVAPWLNKSSEPPTAMVVDSWDVAAALVPRLNDNGWPVPERLSVLAISSRMAAPASSHDISSLLVPTQQMLLAAVRMTADLIKAKRRATQVIRLAARYVPGQTCRAVGNTRSEGQQ